MKLKSWMLVCTRFLTVSWPESFFPTPLNFWEISWALECWKSLCILKEFPRFISVFICLDSLESLETLEKLVKVRCMTDKIVLHSCLLMVPCKDWQLGLSCLGVPIAGLLSSFLKKKINLMVDLSNLHTFHWYLSVTNFQLGKLSRSV